MMKTLQTCSLLILAIALGIISAQAQAISRYRAQIPFDFRIGQKTYPAGEYDITMSNQSSQAQWSLASVKTHSLRLVSVLMNGQCSHNRETNLLFTSFENQYVLTDMAAPEFGVRISRPKFRQQLAEKLEQPKTVALTYRQ